MIAKLMENPYCDIKTVRDGFLAAYYGAGWESIAEFLDIVTEDAPGQHLGIYQRMQSVLSLSREQIRHCDALWQNAEDLAQGEAKQNVLNSEMCWRYWKMKNRVSEYSSVFDYKERKTELENDINAADVDWYEFGGARNFFIHIYQDLYFKIYPVLRFVLTYIVYRL